MLLPGLFRDCEKLIHRPLSPLSPPDSDVGVSGCIYSLIKYYRAELEKKERKRRPDGTTLPSSYCPSDGGPLCTTSRG